MLDPSHLPPTTSPCTNVLHCFRILSILIQLDMFLADSFCKNLGMYVLCVWENGKQTELHSSFWTKEKWDKLGRGSQETKPQKKWEGSFFVETSVPILALHFSFGENTCKRWRIINESKKEKVVHFSDHSSSLIFYDSGRT